MVAGPAPAAVAAGPPLGVPRGHAETPKRSDQGHRPERAPTGRQEHADPPDGREGKPKVSGTFVRTSSISMWFSQRLVFNVGLLRASNTIVDYGRLGLGCQGPLCGPRQAGYVKRPGRGIDDWKSA